MSVVPVVDDEPPCCGRCDLVPEGRGSDWDEQLAYS